MHILPIRSESPETNMALDLLLLKSYPEPEIPRFRHYGWSLPTWTFGYSQKWSIKHDIIRDLAAHIIRRPTGGGLVDHLHDWTYSLVIPPSNHLFREKAVLSYKTIHEALTEALKTNGSTAVVKPSEETQNKIVNSSIPDTLSSSDICFEHPEVYDVVHENGAKIAGAAQKRSREGLLFQGSINRQAVDVMNWGAFLETFCSELSTAMGTSQKKVDFPRFDPKKIEELNEKFNSEDWNRQR